MYNETGSTYVIDAFEEMRIKWGTRYRFSKLVNELLGLSSLLCLLKKISIFNGDGYLAGKCLQCIDNLLVKNLGSPGLHIQGPNHVVADDQRQRNFCPGFGQLWIGKTFIISPGLL